MNTTPTTRDAEDSDRKTTRKQQEEQTPKDRAEGSSSPLSILTASTMTREASARRHAAEKHKSQQSSGLTQFHDVRIPTPPAPQFHIQTPDSLQTQVESLVKIMFDPTAHSIIADEQVRHWQLYLQNKTYADPYYTFPNHFIHNCIFHFDVALHREVKSFIELSIHHIQEDQEQQPNTKLIAWQRNLRFRCKIQPFAFSTWQQLIYDVEFDDLANSVGFTYRQKQH
ncbi:unnamed protein product [Symbiodinium sp. CCMP2592]|nr:unnamed protein product [Symbiodinium sp. CCMP2592]CAE7438104.1 unnamed protein product [Symbiodinium sp. CCMP2592]